MDQKAYICSAINQVYALGRAIQQPWAPKEEHHLATSKNVGAPVGCPVLWRNPDLGSGYILSRTGIVCKFGGDICEGS